jgi:hypothetical protein
MNEKQKKHFWSLVDKTRGARACWPWTGATNNKGYGVVRIGEAFDYAHRIAFRLSGGRIGKRQVRRTCTNTTCCNPRHLGAK